MRPLRSVNQDLERPVKGTWMHSSRDPICSRAPAWPLVALGDRPVLGMWYLLDPRSPSTQPRTARTGCSLPKAVVSRCVAHFPAKSYLSISQLHRESLCCCSFSCGAHQTRILGFLMHVPWNMFGSLQVVTLFCFQFQFE